MELKNVLSRETNGKKVKIVKNLDKLGTENEKEFTVVDGILMNDDDTNDVIIIPEEDYLTFMKNIATGKIPAERSSQLFQSVFDVENTDEVPTEDLETPHHYIIIDNVNSFFEATDSYRDARNIANQIDGSIVNTYTGEIVYVSDIIKHTVKDGCYKIIDAFEVLLDEKQINIPCDLSFEEEQRMHRLYGVCYYRTLKKIQDIFNQYDDFHERTKKVMDVFLSLLDEKDVKIPCTIIKGLVPENKRPNAKKEHDVDRFYGSEYLILKSFIEDISINY